MTFKAHSSITTIDKATGEATTTQAGSYMNASLDIFQISLHDVVDIKRCTHNLGDGDKVTSIVITDSKGGSIVIKAFKPTGA